MVAQEVDPYAELREAVRALCARFPAAYFREIDRERGYPDAFVRALTEAGWLAALIAVFVAIAALPAGWAIHRIGSRRAAVFSFIVLAAGGVGAVVLRRNAILHLGQAPGARAVTSGCIGHT